jgi:hypothetical protein
VSFSACILKIADANHIVKLCRKSNQEIAGGRFLPSPCCFPASYPCEALGGLPLLLGSAPLDAGLGFAVQAPSKTSVSTVTITTLGYGDILPVTTRARVIVATEAILGVFSAGVFLSKMGQKNRKIRNEKK